jgi:hypothetical protein
MTSLLRLAIIVALAAPFAGAQGNYEIQVYPSETAQKGMTFFELHSNYTLAGSRTLMDGIYPTNDALHETLEITRGFSDIFEVGFYFFTADQTGRGWQYVGSHIRPRVRIPEDWHWPVGVSLSSEIGYVKKGYDPNQWSVELRPIIDQHLGIFYWSINPAVDWSLQGADAGTGLKGVIFNPNVKVSWDLNKYVTAGFEYYGSTGPVTGLAPIGEQQHVLYPALDFNVSPEWELNVGYGFPLAGGGDHSIVKVIVGRRFPF